MVLRVALKNDLNTFGRAAAAARRCFDVFIGDAAAPPGL